MEKLVILTSFFASGADAWRLAPEKQVAGGRLGFTPGALQRAWKSAIAPGVSITPHVQFGNAPQLNSHRWDSSTRPNFAGPSMSAADEGLASSDVEKDLHPESVNMNGVDVSGSSLRSTVLTDTSGRRVPVSSLIGDQGKAVVVFLRHLG